MGKIACVFLPFLLVLSSLSGGWSGTEGGVMPFFPSDTRSYLVISLGIPAEDVAAYWSFDNGRDENGRRYYDDLTGNGYNMWTEEAVEVDGYTGRGLRFAGNQHAYVENTDGPDGLGLARNSDDWYRQRMTVNIVMKTDGNPVMHGSFLDYNGRAGEISLEWHQYSSWAQAKMFGIDRRYDFVSFSGEWVMYTYVFDGGLEFPDNVRVYVDGWECTNNILDSMYDTMYGPTESFREYDDNFWENSKFPTGLTLHGYDWETYLMYGGNQQGEFNFTVSDLFILKRALSAEDIWELTRKFNIN